MLSWRPRRKSHYTLKEMICPEYVYTAELVERRCCHRAANEPDGRERPIPLRAPRAVTAPVRGGRNHTGCEDLVKQRQIPPEHDEAFGVVNKLGRVLLPWVQPHRERHIGATRPQPLLGERERHRLGELAQRAGL